MVTLEKEFSCRTMKTLLKCINAFQARGDNDIIDVKYERKGKNFVAHVKYNVVY